MTFSPAKYIFETRLNWLNETDILKSRVYAMIFIYSTVELLYRKILSFLSINTARNEDKIIYVLFENLSKCMIVYKVVAY